MSTRLEVSRTASTSSSGAESPFSPPSCTNSLKVTGGAAAACRTLEAPEPVPDPGVLAQRYKSPMAYPSPAARAQISITTRLRHHIHASPTGLEIRLIVQKVVNWVGKR
ncbi:hypothetical protein E4U40_007688 [Claviceps sp. LM458 group G5]|nr:hypothetical protein E4U40_007688 [Claviceps sp. LM458 group G5]